ncbi:MAG: LysM peptidoglycan-binding domain-containing protein [Thermoanaerobaculia bacterium]
MPAIFSTTFGEFAMMARNRSLSCLLVGLALATGAARADTRPPQNLHLVGDHWTPWDPPTTFAEGAQVYTIVRGDTLWDLSNRFYGDPYLWPQLWEANRYILDAHWIYPGDPLVVGFEVTPLEELAGLGEGAAAEPESMFDRESGAPVPLGVESDIYCSGFIAAPGRGFPYQILGSEYQNLGATLTASRRQRRYEADPISAPTAKVNLSAGDVLYLSGGRQAGLNPGTVFTVVEPAQLVSHPDSGAPVGQLYRFVGRVRVLSVQDVTAIAEIVSSCSPIIVGQYLEPFEPQPIPLRRRSPMRGVNDPEPWGSLENGPTIVLADDAVVSLGQDNVVYIDRGAVDDVAPGDMYTIYRRSAAGLPPMVIGELAVLSVHERSALARILESRYAIYVGDRASPKLQ